MNITLVAILVGIGAVLVGMFIARLQRQIEDLAQSVTRGLGDSSRMLQSQFTESMRIVQDVTRHVVELKETNRQVVSFADQLQNLQDILKNPKQRGVVGEYYLETLLKNVMPPGSYQMQYGFPNGTIVDAAVFVKDKIIPIDSKFSLENYNRIAETRDPVERAQIEKTFVNDLKNRIAETSQYIQPEQGTTEFAFMFIPHEAIYYDLLINKIGAVTQETENLIQRAAGKYRVIIVSPTSFLAYLQTVLQGLKAMQIEESAKEIVKRVEELKRHLLSHEEFMRRLGANMGAAVSSYNAAYKEFGKIDKDILKIAGSSNKIDPVALEKPDAE